MLRVSCDDCEYHMGNFVIEGSTELSEMDGMTVENIELLLLRNEDNLYVEAIAFTSPSPQDIEQIKATARYCAAKAKSPRLWPINGYSVDLPSEINEHRNNIGYVSALPCPPSDLLMMEDVQGELLPEEELEIIDDVVQALAHLRKVREEARMDMRSWIRIKDWRLCTGSFRFIRTEDSIRAFVSQAWFFGDDNGLLPLRPREIEGVNRISVETQAAMFLAKISKSGDARRSIDSVIQGDIEFYDMTEIISARKRNEGMAYETPTELKQFCQSIQEVALKVPAAKVAHEVREKSLASGCPFAITRNQTRSDYFRIELKCSAYKTKRTEYHEKDCTAKIRFIYNRGQCQLTSTNWQHNHPIAKSTRYITTGERETILDLRRQGIKTGMIRAKLNLDVSPSALYNVVRKVNKQLQKTQEDDLNEALNTLGKEWHVKERIDSSGKFMGVTLISSIVAKSRFAGDLWLFDDTSCTNNEELPVVPIIVPDEHGRALFLAVGVLENRSSDVFRRFFNDVISVTGGGPRIGIADRHAGQKSGFLQACPRSKVIFCRRHIRQNIKRVDRSLLTHFDAMNRGRLKQQEFLSIVERKIDEKGDARSESLVLLKQDIECYGSEVVNSSRLLGFRTTNICEGSFGNVKGMLGFERKSLAEVIKAFTLYARMMLRRHEEASVPPVPKRIFDQAGSRPVGRLAAEALVSAFNIAARWMRSELGEDRARDCLHHNNTEFGLPCECWFYERVKNGARGTLVQENDVPARLAMSVIAGTGHEMNERTCTTVDSDNHEMSYTAMIALFEHVAARALRETEVKKAISQMFETVDATSGKGAGRQTVHPARNVDKVTGRQRGHRSVYRCSNCKQAGHNRKTCPKVTKHDLAQLEDEEWQYGAYWEALHQQIEIAFSVELTDLARPHQVQCQTWDPIAAIRRLAFPVLNRDIVFSNAITLKLLKRANTEPLNSNWIRLIVLLFMNWTVHWNKKDDNDRKLQNEFMSALCRFQEFDGFRETVQELALDHFTRRYEDGRRFGRLFFQTAAAAKITLVEVLISKLIPCRYNYSSGCEEILHLMERIDFILRDMDGVLLSMMEIHLLTSYGLGTPVDWSRTLATLARISSLLEEPHTWIVGRDRSNLTLTVKEMTLNVTEISALHWQSGVFRMTRSQEERLYRGVRDAIVYIEYVAERVSEDDQVSH